VGRMTTNCHSQRQQRGARCAEIHVLILPVDLVQAGRARLTDNSGTVPVIDVRRLPGLRLARV
jgi:hypothetical protein